MCWRCSQGMHAPLGCCQLPANANALARSTTYLLIWSSAPVDIQLQKIHRTTKILNICKNKYHSQKAFPRRFVPSEERILCICVRGKTKVAGGEEEEKQAAHIIICAQYASGAMIGIWIWNIQHDIIFCSSKRKLKQRYNEKSNLFFGGSFYLNQRLTLKVFEVGFWNPKTNGGLVGSVHQINFCLWSMEHE